MITEKDRKIFSEGTLIGEIFNESMTGNQYFRVMRDDAFTCVSLKDIVILMEADQMRTLHSQLTPRQDQSS